MVWLFPIDTNIISALMIGHVFPSYFVSLNLSDEHLVHYSKVCTCGSEG
jgi:hypothetical protein